MLKIATNRDDDNPFGWYQLGTVYEADRRYGACDRSPPPNSASLTGDTVRTAVYRARVPRWRDLPPNSSDWLRAQDIVMTGQNELDDQKRKKKR